MRPLSTTVASLADATHAPGDERCACEPTECDTRIADVQPSSAAFDPRIDALVRLLPLWPHEIADQSVAARTRLVAHLRRALRSERQRGVAGHWTYSVSRHAALSRLYHSELAGLRASMAAAARSTHEADAAKRADTANAARGADHQRHGELRMAEARKRGAPETTRRPRDDGGATGRRRG